MTEKPYSDADVELLAIAEFDADQRHLVATSPNPAALEPTPWSLPILAHIRETYRNRARAGLDALAAKRPPAADLPSTNEEILVWLARHGLSTTPGVGVVLSAARRDILGICSACGPRIAERGEPNAA